MEEKITVLRELLLEKLPRESIIRTGIKGVNIFRIEKAYEKRPQLYDPQIILLAQGKKTVYLGDRAYTYDPCHYYVQTVPLPVQCEAVIGEGKPMVGLAVKIDPQIIGEILFEMEVTHPVNGRIEDSLYNAEVTGGIADAAIRMVRTLESPNETRVLGPVFLKELLYRILTGEKGKILGELAVNSRGFYQISRVINRIHSNYSQPFEVLSLAREAGMSSTAFHASFKAMTSTTPLQYIKNIRLHKAKELIQQGGEKANTAALLVGYESSSQFSREYKRCFGIAPSLDRQGVQTY